MARKGRIGQGERGPLREGKGEFDRDASLSWSRGTFESVVDQDQTTRVIQIEFDNSWHEEAGVAGEGASRRKANNSVASTEEIHLNERGKPPVGAQCCTV
ncbi:Uncharacterized protein MLTONO_5186 [Mesorhizobium loti]|nr:Uncharacterized protein MLTONO_5186 [Mesorhizobium loti]BCH19317.1 hypothetical protein MesoLjLa_61680 [Mesorhizobium sp. L-2-11]BCH27135.1 hypothetical protein MesoLjLb_69200 [Mesorhizobium sp. L-8-3]